MFEGLRNFVSFFELGFLPEERLRPSRSVRILIALGGALCLVFGVLTSFTMGLALIGFWMFYYGEPWHPWYPPMVFQPRPVVYSLLLVCPAGILSLIASTGRRGRRVALLSHWGAFVGLFGSSLCLFEEGLLYGGSAGGWSGPGLGFSIVLLGICLMLAYPMSIRVLPKVLTVPLLVTPLLMFAIYPDPGPMIVEPLAGLYRLYNSLLYLILPALTLAIPIGIRFMALPGRSTKAQSSQMLQA